MKLHIGKEIELRYKESGIKLSEFAKRLSTTPRNVYTIFERSDIKTDLLQKIGEVLHFNFFQLYQTGINAEESEMRYEKRQRDNKLSVIVVLDGDEDTLNHWIKKLVAINKTLA
jgi:hypothetical protein